MTNAQFPPADEPAQPRISTVGRGKGILTETVHERVVTALRAGCYVKDACAYAGIYERRYYEWHKRGCEYDEHIEDGGEVIDGEDAYRLFALECDQARAEARVSAVHALRRAWEDDKWQAAAVFLERTDPQHWGKVARVEMGGRDGGAIEVDITVVERELAQSIQSRALTIDVDAVEDTVARALPAAAAIVDDDEPEELLIPGMYDDSYLYSD